MRHVHSDSVAVQGFRHGLGHESGACSSSSCPAVAAFSYTPAKAVCREEALPFPQRHMPCQPQFTVRNVQGDGRCGCRALALCLGTSSRCIMQSVLRAMVQHQHLGFSPAAIIQLAIACDLRNACPTEAWLTVRAFVAANPSLFPAGILVKIFYQTDELSFVHFQHSAEPVHLPKEAVSAQLSEGWNPSILGLVQQPTCFFVQLIHNSAAIEMPDGPSRANPHRAFAAPSHILARVLRLSRCLRPQVPHGLKVAPVLAHVVD